jgi:long-chain-fatty-acid---luciferin-component ligase
LATQTYIIKDNEFDFARAVNFINEWNGKIPVYIVGPPFIVNFFLEYLKANKITFNLGKTGRVITTGGWKRYTGQIITRDDFIQKCADAFGIKRDQYRDMYGLIELNQLSIECSNHKKHVPPFSEFFIRDLENHTKLCPDGKEGLISIIDPTVMAYPGFLITQDVGVVHHEYKCACGRTSTIMNIIGRAPLAEDINCSITLDQYLSGKTNKLNYSYS